MAFHITSIALICLIFPIFLPFLIFHFRFFVADVVLAMAKHQRRSFATDYSQQPYHDEMHRQSYHQKSKLVTKPNLRYAKNPTRSDARKNRYGTGLIKNSKPIDLFLHFSFGNTNDIFITFDISPLCIRLTRTNEKTHCTEIRGTKDIMRNSKITHIRIINPLHHRHSHHPNHTIL